MKYRVANLAAAAMVFMNASFSVNAEDLKTINEYAHDLIEGIERSDFDQASIALRGASQRLKQLYRLADEAAELPVEVLENLETAGQILGREPLVLKNTLADAQRASEVLKTTEVTVPPFGNPLAGISEEHLKSDASEVRLEALRTALQQGDELKLEYEQARSQLIEAREKAFEIQELARADYDRINQSKELLREFNETYAGGLTNALSGNKVAYIVFDAEIYLQPAVAERLNAAEDLVRRYDEAIVEMDSALQKYEQFKDWTAAIAWQDWARSEHSKSLPDTIELGEDFDLAMELEQQITRDLSALEDRKPASIQTQRLEELAQRVTTNNDITQARAKELLKEAFKEDRAAAATSDFFAIVGLVSAIDNFSSVVASSAPETNAQPDRQHQSRENNAPLVSQSITPQEAEIFRQFIKSLSVPDDPSRSDNNEVELENRP